MIRGRKCSDLEWKYSVPHLTHQCSSILLHFLSLPLSHCHPSFRVLELSHNGSTAFRCHLAYLVQGTDMQANRQNWMYGTLLGSRSQFSSFSSATLTHAETKCTTYFFPQISVPVLFTLFSYPALLPLLCPSLSITLYDCTLRYTCNRHSLWECSWGLIYLFLYWESSAGGQTQQQL